MKETTTKRRKSKNEMTKKQKAETKMTTGQGDGGEHDQDDENEKMMETNMARMKNKNLETTSRTMKNTETTKKTTTKKTMSTK